MKPIVIVADASHDARTGAAGWAARIHLDNGPMLVSGQIAELQPTSLEAELLAMMHGLREAIERTGSPIVGGEINFQTDCREAIAAIIFTIPGAVQKPSKGGVRVPEAKRLSPSLKESTALHLMFALVITHELNLTLTHIEQNETRQRLSTWEFSRRGMIDRRKALYACTR